jgi:hypothetical protein
MISKISKPIICNETGKMYKSAKVASQELQIGHSSITGVLKGRRKSVHGYTFSYIKKE